MAMRRQRIKATANLSHVKRKPRKEEPPISVEACPQPLADVTPLEPIKSCAEIEDDYTAFKMPAASAGQLEDAFQSDVEDIIQMDLQKTSNGCPMSPTKAQARQRVRPMPVFGQRRNSLAGSPLTGDGDTSTDYSTPPVPPRRERYLSGSSSVGSTPQQQSQPSAMPQSPYRYFPPVMSPGVGRIRTESTCSAYSDTCQPKHRKTEGGEKGQQTQQQRVNARRDFETRFNKGVPDKSMFKMFDLIYYNPCNNPMEQKHLINPIKAETEDTKPKAEVSSEALDTKPELATAMPVPQLKLDANGEMIIDEKTLEIETTAEVEARKVLANSSLILMDETTGNNGFYKRHNRTRVWSSEETLRFYRSLQIIGTDFSLMCQMFPDRSRRDLKLKFKKEERVNAQLINKALLYPKTFNIQELKDQLEQEAREKAELEEQWKNIKEVEPKIPKKARKSALSKADRNLSDGDVLYENEHVVKQKVTKRAWAKRCAAMEAKNDENANAIQFTESSSPKPNSDVEHVPVRHPFGVKDERVVKREKGLKETDLLQEELNNLLDEDDQLLPDNTETAVIDLEDKRNFKASQLKEELQATGGGGGGEIIPAMDIDDCEMVATPASEHDIEQILIDLANGSLVIVSSIDEQDGRVISEIYMYDNQTGDLFEHPLDIPEHIVQCIVNVMR